MHFFVFETGGPLGFKGRTARPWASSARLAAVAAALMWTASAMADGSSLRHIDDRLVTSPTPADYNCGLANFSEAILRRINDYRSAGFDCRTRGTFDKANPLAWSENLLAAAIGHSRYMATNGHLSHTTADGRTSKMRITDAGYAPWRAIGENIAVGYVDVNSVVDSWMESDSHCANIMSPTFSDVGVACYGLSGDGNSHYWTMDLGKLR